MEGFTVKPSSWYNHFMRTFLFLCVAVLPLWAPALFAAKVVSVSTGESKESITRESTQPPMTGAMKASKEQADPKKKEQLLRELRELYKSGRSVD